MEGGKLNCMMDAEEGSLNCLRLFATEFVVVERDGGLVSWLVEFVDDPQR
jgi:hypothetical protein